jgi:hypothetical protein
MIPLIPWLMELAIWAAAGMLAVGVFGAIGGLIVEDRLEEAEAQISTMDAERREDLVRAYRQERPRMSAEQRRRWELVLRRQGLLGP